MTAECNLELSWPPYLCWPAEGARTRFALEGGSEAHIDRRRMTSCILRQRRRHIARGTVVEKCMKMPHSCAAWGCTNRCTLQTRYQGITFHRFPKVVHIRKQWEAALGRDGFTASDSSRLCSEHFRHEDFDLTGQTVRLRDGALPSVFRFPASLQRTVASRTTQTSLKVQERRSADSCLPVQEAEALPDPCVVATKDHSYVLPSSLDNLRARLNETLSRVESMEKQRRNAKDGERRAKTIVCGLLQDLREKSLVNEELKERLDSYSEAKMGNESSKSSKRSLPPKMEAAWRSVKWSGKEETLGELDSFRANLNVLKILLYGPVGAGKSCFINSVQRGLVGRNAIGALENTTQSGRSFTMSIKSHRLKKRGGGFYPFVLTDLTGLEVSDGEGIQTEDIIKAIGGHISEGYTFNPRASINEEHPKYVHNPSLNDKVHCLVTILPADSISLMDDKVIDKMKVVRQKASELNIPQIIVLTKVDKACPIVNKDVRKIYQSRKIKDKVHECSNRLGLSLNSIYPVKNYHAEITQDENIDTLILMALRDMVNFANDFVEDEFDLYGNN